jgi:hypothetical protein
MEDEREEIRDDEEEVADEATPETDEEATEQRTDDYDGLVRRLDEIADMVRDRFDAIERAIDALGVSTVESGADGTVADAAGEAAADVIDELLGIDGLDLL